VESLFANVEPSELEFSNDAVERRRRWYFWAL
jgi:hypothetical protein